MIARPTALTALTLRVLPLWLSLLSPFSSTTTTTTMTANAAPLEDLVDYLPLYGRPPTTQFSGFLDATDGCDTSENGDYCKIHYWFHLADSQATADRDPSDIPVVLWLNGGPGSTAVLGLLQELGPLLINATGGLMDNPWGWTNLAHLLVIEAPVGVGYSYCANQKEKGRACHNTDRYTASASRAALVDFFTNKFPELAHGDFYITGESYAGVYIPTLTKEILDNAADVINLKGIAVGDPCTDNDAQADSMDSLWYAQKYGLVDDEIFDVLWNQCDTRIPNILLQDFTSASVRTGSSTSTSSTVESDSSRRPIMIPSKANRAMQVLRHLMHVTAEHLIAGNNMKDTNECKLAYRKFLMSASKGLSQGWRDLYIDDYSLFAPVSSKEDEDMATYMMRADVRKALHVEESPTKSWPNADVGFDYKKEYDACNWGQVVIDKSMIDIYREIIPKLDTTFIYNGDTDPCVSYEGTRIAAKRIGFEELDGGSYRPWFYNQTSASIEVLAAKSPLFGPDLLVQDMGPQFGGEIVSYEHNFSFLTFHGSGHMVPQFRPQAALHMVDKLIGGKDLSPLLPSNKTLVELSETDFRKAMEGWTEAAQQPPYVTSGGKR